MPFLQATSRTSSPKQNSSAASSKAPPTAIKLLSLDGTLEFMSAGGQRVMEVEDIDGLLGCPWPGFWPGEGGIAAQRAVDEANAGRVSRFEGQAPTAKGNDRWWEVTVSPVAGPDGRPAKLLSISRDITARVESDRVRDLLLQESSIA